MRDGKRPTVRQKKLMKQYGLNCENWLVRRDNIKEMVIVHRYIIEDNANHRSGCF